MEQDDERSFNPMAFDRGERLLEIFLEDERPRPQRIILIGQGIRWSFYRMILNLGMPVCTLSAGRDFDTLSLFMPRLGVLSGGRLSFIRCDVVQDPLDIRPGDGVILMRALHHFEAPAATLGRIFEHTLAGCPLFILDTTAELEEWHLQEWVQWSRSEQAHELARSQPEFLAVIEQQAAGRQKCAALLERCGLTDEDAVRRMMMSAGIPVAQLEYNPKCVCAPWSWCGDWTNYWIAVAYGR